MRIVRDDPSDECRKLLEEIQNNVDDYSPYQKVMLTESEFAMLEKNMPEVLRRPPGNRIGGTLSIITGENEHGNRSVFTIKYEVEAE